jgi:hypothetical protein
MLYDEVKKLLTKSKLPKNFKKEFSQKAKVNIKDLTVTEQETVTALNNSINNATVILIEDNRRIFEEIEHIKIEQFKELKFPFDNFFIEFDMLNPNPEGNSNHNSDTLTIGLHVYPDHVIGLKSDNIYNVFMYNRKGNSIDKLVPLMAMLKLNKLPRFYVGCSQKCDNIINPSNLGNMINKEVCQRTERTAEQCHIAQFLLFGIKVVIYTVNFINSKPKLLQGDYGYNNNSNSIRTGVPNLMRNLKIVYNSEHSVTPGKYIYIQVEKPKRKNLRIRRVTGNRKSPIEHIRRGHYRRLKSGKVIWVQMSYIGLKEKAEKKRKIYKIK